MDKSYAEAANRHSVLLDEILTRLREMFGNDRAVIQTGDRFRVAGEESRVVTLPQNIEELSEILKLASVKGWKVIPAGAGRWLEMGNRPREFHLVVSTSRMDRILDYEPADLTVTLEAGCALKAFNQLAAQNRQFIPLDPFGDADLTIGGTIATASIGPMRCAYGTPRDWLIGIRVVHADGRITKAGGKVVKNVAGYDLCKLYTGSYGTLGVIAEMSFKLRALPADEKTLIFYTDDLNALWTLAGKITDSDLHPTSCELLKPGDTVLPVEDRSFALVLRFLNEEETVKSQIEDALRLGGSLRSTQLSDEDAEAFWRVYNQSETTDQWSYSLRLSALPADLRLTIDDLNSVMPGVSWRAHAASGIIRARAEAGWLNLHKTDEHIMKLIELRQRTQSRGGQLTILRAPDDVTGRIDVWGEVGTTESLMRALKEKFDPESQLNPGRFVAGI
jgi:glycolate dehydrogenase FAD-binding subunit